MSGAATVEPDAVRDHLARMTFFSSDFHAGENSLARAAKTSSSVWARWAFASSLTADMFASRSFRSETRR